MPKKTKIIFITVFIIVGIIVLGVYFWLNKNQTDKVDGTTPWYQSFNPFGTGSNVDNPKQEPVTNDNPNQEPSNTETRTSKFYQITDFAVAGATFLEDTRPIAVEQNTTSIPEPEQIKTIISADTKEGRKEIQTILNETLTLKPPLIVDGGFGKLAVEAIKAYQKLNNLTITGKVDTETAPYFTKTTTPLNISSISKFEQAPSVRYVERMNGHIYKMFLDTKNKEKISNSTIPGIYEAFFDSTAKTVIYRYLSEDKSISSFVAALGAAKGEFLSQGITDLSTSFDKTKFFYLTENSNGVTGTVGIFGESKKDMVFNSPFTEWLSVWSNENIYLTTKPSYSVDGSMFLLNTTNKTISKVFGGVAGLTTLVSPSGSYVLYSTSTKTGPRLGVFNIADHSIKDLNTYGLPEKCTWSSDSISVYCAVPNIITGNQYPDLWYQGLISFEDYFVKINTATNDKLTIVNSIDETPVDGMYLFLSKDEYSLFFINKKDSTLWSLDVR